MITVKYDANNGHAPWIVTIQVNDACVSLAYETEAEANAKVKSHKELEKALSNV